MNEINIYSDSDDHESFVDCAISGLNRINKKIAKLQVMKEELVEKLIGAFSHEHEGQKSYNYGEWKIEIKTPCIFSLDKKAWEEIKDCIPADFNPVRESIAYTIDRAKCERFIESSPAAIRNHLISVIEKRPGKPSVTIRERV